MAFDSQGRPLRYSSLRPVYSLNILGYTHFPDDDDALRIFELYDAKRSKRFYKDYLRIGYFELTKSGIETQRQRYWHEYFNTGEVGPDAPEYIQKASSIIEYSNLTEEELTMAKTLERAQAIYEADMYGSFIEGEAKGEAKGEAAKARAIAINLLKMDISVEQVVTATGLTHEEVEGLQQQGDLHSST